MVFSSSSRMPGETTLLRKAASTTTFSDVLAASLFVAAQQRIASKSRRVIVPHAFMSEDITNTNGDGEPQTDTAPAETASAEPKNDPAAEIARLRDQLLRTAADFDNFRKRARREQDDAQ